MLRGPFTEQERREDANDRRDSWMCVVLSLILYGLFFMSIGDNLWNSYVETSCIVVNSTAVEKHCCWKYRSKPLFDAVWVIDVHPNRWHPTRYLADIREQFDTYYEAYEAISTYHLIGSQESCYVYSSNKFDIRWTGSSTQGIISALFGVVTLIFIIFFTSFIRDLLKNESSL